MFAFLTEVNRHDHIGFVSLFRENYTQNTTPLATFIELARTHFYRFVLDSFCFRFSHFHRKSWFMQIHTNWYLSAHWIIMNMNAIGIRSSTVFSSFPIESKTLDLTKANNRNPKKITLLLLWILKISSKEFSWIDD